MVKTFIEAACDVHLDNGISLDVCAGTMDVCAGTVLSNVCGVYRAASSSEAELVKQYIQ